MGGDGVVAWLYTFEHDGETDHALSLAPFIEPWILRKQANVTPLIPQSTHQSLLDRMEALAEECEESSRYGGYTLDERNAYSECSTKMRSLVAEAKNDAVNTNEELK